MSEDHFTTADKVVSAAERYSEKRVKSAKEILVRLNVGFILLVFLFLVYGHWQRKMQHALDMAEKASQAKSEFLSSMSHEKMCIRDRSKIWGERMRRFSSELREY